MKKRRDEYYQQAALSYHQQKQAYEDQKKVFEEAKEKFEEVMFACCDESGNKRHRFVLEDFDNEDTIINVTKVEKTTIEWLAEKLEKRVPKAIARKFIRKQYAIANWPGMVEYLKALGAKPADFKKFLRVERTVDEKVIDHLSDIGELTVRDIAGCYLVKSQKPYFTISVKKGFDDDK